MTAFISVEVKIGENETLTQERLAELIAGSFAGNEEEGKGPWFPDLEKSTPGLLISMESANDAVIVNPSKLDIFDLVLVNDSEKEVTIKIQAFEVVAPTEETTTEGVNPDVTEETPPVETPVEETPAAETAPAVETEEQPAAELQAPVVTDDAAPEASVQASNEPEAGAQYTPPAAAAAYDPDADATAAVKRITVQLDEYVLKMNKNAMVTVEIAVKQQVKLLSIVQQALGHGGRKTELCLHAILEYFADAEKYNNVFKETLINRYVTDAFRANKTRELFKDLTTTLLIASKVGRRGLGKHVDFRRMEAGFDNPKHYSNLCTYFAVKD